MNLTFSGSRALVLGGSCELALATAKAMIASSLLPILTYRSADGLGSINRALQAHAGKYNTAYLNFTDRESLVSLFSQTGDALDFIVDFAHGNYEVLVAQADEDDVYSYFAENVAFRATFLKMAGRLLLKKRKGRLVFVSSTAAERPNPGQGFYAAAKLASEALYRTLGLELGGRGISTVILRPGYVYAGRGRAYVEDRGQKILESVPIQRALTAEEIAKTILYLISESASGINAAVLTIDGGFTYGK